MVCGGEAEEFFCGFFFLLKFFSPRAGVLIGSVTDMNNRISRDPGSMRVVDEHFSGGSEFFAGVVCSVLCVRSVVPVPGCPVGVIRFCLRHDVVAAAARGRFSMVFPLG